MTTTLGFVRSHTFDDKLGPGGTIALIAALARHAPQRRLRVLGAEGLYLEVDAGGSVRPMVFGEDDDPDGDLEPAVRGNIGWPSDPPSLRGLIVPGWDEDWNLDALRAEPLLRKAMLPESVGCTVDGRISLAMQTFDADEPDPQAQAAGAWDLLEVAALLGLVMVYW